MRSWVPLATLAALSLSAVPVCTSQPDGAAPDLTMIQALEAKARHAQPREQCFLYAQLVHQMTELSVRQYATGNVEMAEGLLKHIQETAQKIHLSLNDNDKRLKDTELLLSRTVFRLTEMLRASSYEDQPLVERTLAEVNHAQNQAMMAVFQK